MREVAPGLVQTALFDMPAALAEKRLGQQRAIDSRVNAEWRRRAEQAIRTLMQTTPRFTADDVAIMAGLPPSRNGMGALFGAFHRRGQIESIGWTTGRRKDRHGGSQRVWRATNATAQR
jgi:hypothetical protein